MATLAEFRQQYPQYDSVSDPDLASALYTKYYADKMPRDAFDKQIGAVPSNAADKGDLGAAPLSDKVVADETPGMTIAPKGGTPFTADPANAAGMFPTRSDPAFTYGFSQGLSFNTSDELGGALQTAVNGGDLSKNIDDYNRSMEYARQQYPGIYATGQVMGGLASGMGLLKGGLSLTKAAYDAGLPYAERVAAAAIEGSGLSAAYGAGGAQGGLTERAKGAAEAMPTGALMGPLAETGGTVLGNVLRRSADPAAQAAVDLAASHGIDLTRGQATGDLAQQAYEEAARHGTEGLIPQRVMTGSDNSQLAQVQAAKQGIQQDLGNIGPARMPTIIQPQDAGENIVNAVGDQANQLKTAADAAYDQFRSGNANLSTDALPSLKTSMDSALSPIDAVVTPATTPTAWALRQKINQFASMGHVTETTPFKMNGLSGVTQPTVTKPVAVSLDGLDQLRQLLNKAKGTNPQDWDAISTMRRGFDDWLDNAVDNSLFSGDKNALDALKQARGLWFQYRTITNPRTGDDAGRVIAKMVDGDIKPVEATNWILGTSNMGATGRAVRVTERLRTMFGDNSEQFSSLRQAMFLKLVSGANNPGPQLVAKNLTQFLDGNGSDLAKVLYTPDQLNQLRSFRDTVQRLVLNPKAGNPSKSGYVLSRLIHDKISNTLGLIGGYAGFHAGGPLGSAIGFAAGRSVIPMFRGSMGSLKALRAANSPVPTIGQAIPGMPALSGAVSQFQSP